MREIILNILAFLLGIRNKTPEELEASGVKMIVDSILKKLGQKVNVDNIFDIWLLGAIEYSESEVKRIEEQLKIGNRYDFSPPASYNFEGSYIDFYQISTKDNRWFIFAMTDLYEFSKEDSVIMFVEINERYNTDGLPSKRRYYSANCSSDK